MRAEMEESPSSKRTVRQACNDKASSPKLQSPPALTWTTNHSLLLNSEHWLQLPAQDLSVPRPPALALADRAPPDSLLA